MSSLHFVIFCNMGAPIYSMDVLYILKIGTLVFNYMCGYLYKLVAPDFL